VPSMAPAASQSTSAPASGPGWSQAHDVRPPEPAPAETVRTGAAEDEGAPPDEPAEVKMRRRES
jgi:hypothetical protein